MSKPTSTATALVFALASATALPALAQDTQPSMPMQGGMSGDHMMQHKGAPAKGADAEFRRDMLTMRHNMNMKMTGDADKDFVAMMVPHHQGAIDMAKVELKYGKDPELKKMAQDIVDAQEKEIAFMKDWQAKQAK